jgi:recombination protein RecT
MMKKTVLKDTLKKWGILSIEMQKALKADEAAIRSDNLDDPDSVSYPDGTGGKPVIDIQAKTQTETDFAAEFLKTQEVAQ